MRKGFRAMIEIHSHGPIVLSELQHQLGKAVTLDMGFGPVSLHDGHDGAIVRGVVYDQSAIERYGYQVWADVPIAPAS